LGWMAQRGEHARASRKNRATNRITGLDRGGGRVAKNFGFVGNRSLTRAAARARLLARGCSRAAARA
jgi:hypothetical protein